MTARLALTSASVHLRDMRTWLPFRHGVVTLTHAPHLHGMETAP